MSKNKSEESANIKHVSFDKHFTSTWNRTPEDPNLSWGAKGLLWYLLSRTPGWNTKLWHLATVFKGSGKGNGYDAVKKMMKELRDNDYVEYIKSKDSEGKWQHTYVVYPMKIAQFKIMFPEVDLPLVVVPLVVDPPLIINNELPNNELIEISKDISSSLKVSEKPSPDGEKRAKARDKIKDEFSEEVEEVHDKIMGAMQNVKEDYRSRSGQRIAMMTAIDLMIRRDGRDPQKIIEVFRWAVNDHFWQAKMFKPNPAKYLREKFDMLEMQMIAKPAPVTSNKHFAEYTTDQERKDMAKQLKASFKKA